MKDQLIHYIQSQFQAAQNGTPLTSDADLLGSGLIDSLGVMQLITFVEQEFSFKIPLEDMTIENFMTVDAIAAYVKSRTA